MKMICVEIIPEAKSPHNLNLSECTVPHLLPGHVLVKTHFAGVNRPDLLQARGLYDPPKDASPLLGLEVSGEIAALGDGVTGLSLGDFVCALTHGGGYAQYVSIDARHIMPIPKGLGLMAAATLPEVVLTVYANLIEMACLRAGEVVLVHGANSGIGSMTIQMAKAYGAQVIATVRGQDRIAYGHELGADTMIDSLAVEFETEVLRLGGVDVILDILGGPMTGRNLNVLKHKGRLVQVGMQMGVSALIDWRQIMSRQAILTGSMLRPRSNDDKARLVAHVVRDIWPHFETGRIKPLPIREFDLSEAGLAHAYLDSGSHVGKAVLRIPH